MMTCLAITQSLYRAYRAFEALRWQPDSSFREATRLSEESHTIAKLSGIRDDVQIVWANLYGEPARSFGNNSYRSSALYILVDQDYVTTGEDKGWINNAMNVVMRHEYSHLRHDDFFKLKAVPAVASLLSTAIGWCLLSPLATLALTTITGIAAQALYSRYAEERADREAFNASTLEELKDIQHLLKLSKANNIQLRQQNFLGRLYFSAEGEDRRQIFSHPPLSQRIKAVSLAKSFV